MNSMCGRLLKERRDLCFYSKNLAHEYLQAVLDSGYYSVCLVKLVALGVPIGSDLQGPMTACLKITRLVFVYLLFGVFVLFYFCLLCVEYLVDIPCLHWRPRTWRQRNSREWP